MKYYRHRDNTNKENEVRETSAAYLLNFRKAAAKSKKKKSSEKSRLNLASGENFGTKYSIMEEVKRDKMGRIYKAQDKSLNKVVALRIFNPEVSKKDWSSIVQKARDELREMKHNKSEDLTKLYDMGKQGKLKYISMQWSNDFGSRVSIYRELILPLAASIAIVIGIVVFFNKWITRPGSSLITEAGGKSIAVLPFRDLSAAQDQEYFCDGMTEAIIDKLSQLEDLKVISINSVKRYKNTEKDIKEIGTEMGVETVLAGTIQKDESAIRVRARLIDAKDSSHIWSKTYDEKLENVFALQDETAEAIAQALQVKLLPDALADYKTREPKNQEAWEYYLKGMYYLDKRYSIEHKEEDFEAAVRMFNKAIEIDPNYALVYWGLGMVYEIRYISMKDEHDLNLMIDYLEKAYKINPKLAEANAAIGWAYFYKDNMDRAFNAFMKALEIDPNNPIINFHTGSFLASIGLESMAITYYLRSTERDPLFIWNHILLSACFMSIGEYDKASIYITKGQEIEPDSLMLHLNNIKYLIYTEKYDEAQKVLSYLEEVELGNPFVKRYRAWLCAAKGEKEKALELIKDEPSYSYIATSVYSLLGMKDKAIKNIKEGINNGFKYMSAYLYSYPFLVNNPSYINLRDDPRFQEIVKREENKHEEKLKKYGKL